MVDFPILSSRFHIIAPDSFSLGELKSEKEIPEKRSYKDLLKKIMKQYKYVRKYLAQSLLLRFWKIYALYFYRSQNVLGCSKFFVPDQKDDLHSVKLVFVPAQKFLKRH